jgi:phasin family protein
MSLFDIATLQKAQQANLALVQNLSGNLFAGAEKLGQLHYKALTDLAAAQFDYAGKLLAVREPKALLELNAATFSPSALLDRQLAFNRDLLALATETQQQLAHYGEQQVAAGNRQVDEWVEQFASRAPAGAEPAVSALKTAVSNANDAYESVQKAAKDAADIADKAIRQATDSSEKAARQVAEAAEKSLTAASAGTAGKNPRASSTKAG